MLDDKDVVFFWEFESAPIKYKKLWNKKESPDWLVFIPQQSQSSFIRILESGRMLKYTHLTKVGVAGGIVCIAYNKEE